jgi:hypothetical protein
MKIDTFEEALKTGVAPIQMNPLGDAQSQYDMEFGCDHFQHFVRLQHVVALNEPNIVRKFGRFSFGSTR